MIPGVSVIVPLYNKAPYIQRALESIAAQTWRDFEVITVDDGSTDQGPVIAASFADSRFRFVSQSNAGPGAARNRGVREAQGEWIAFLDADDEWGPQYLELGLQMARQSGDRAAAVTSGYWEYPAMVSSEPLWRGRGLKDGLFRLEPGTDPQLAVHALAFMCPPSTIVRKSVCLSAGGFYEQGCRYAEDAYLWLKVLVRQPVVFQLQPLIRVHTEASGLSNNFVRKTPVEPFLTDPGPILEDCPPELQPLLKRILALRAFKRACVLGYWGEFEAARSLRSRFRPPRPWEIPYYFPALLAGTRMAGWGGKLLREWKTGSR